jgi:NADPH:quinone reductase-like Zn-dependent oxidoreductase
VLVHNAGGALGIAATQLARLRRATVIGTASAAKHDALRSFGVDLAIDYRHANVEAEVRRFTRGRGVDVILDPIGGKSFGASYRMLAPMGRLIMLGLSSMSGERRSTLRVRQSWWAMKPFSPLSLINRNRGVFGLHVGHLWEERRPLQPLMELVLSELSASRLDPVVAKTFPLERVADAHRYIHSRANIGKVVLTT